MAVLNIHWETADRISASQGPVTPGEGENAEQPASSTEPTRLDRALVVFIHDTGDAEAEKIEKIALDLDKVRVGSNYFRCVRITPANAKNDPLLAEYAEDAPCFVFVSTESEVVDDLSGSKASGSKIFKAMEKTARKSYEKLHLERNVKSILKVLNELDKIADERKVLEEKENRDPSKSELKKIAKEKEELDGREKEALAERAELLQLEVKTA
jgi:hypothetical protein